ncbi:MAG: MTH938/NDUFAF3 family protein [Bauldia sp.]
MAGAGIVIRAAHYPGRAPIDTYGKGGFRFAGMSHRGSLLCLPSGIYGWDIAAAQAISEESLGRVFAEAEAIDTLLIGTGQDIVPLPTELRDWLREARIVADAMSTGAAVRTFNVLLAEDRAVAAALIAID